jgi:ElaB/YqjD/DUF883 family membrane-anchored ribosome-binding protein
MPGDPSEIIPGLTKPAVIAFARSFEPLLERVDSNKGVDFVHLVYGTSNVPEALLGVLGSVPSQAANGASYFVQNFLGNLLDLRNRLEAAAGPLDSKTAQPAHLRRRLSNLDTIIEEAAARVEGAEAQDQRSREALEQINAQVGDLAQTVEKLNQIEAEITQLRDKARYIVEDDSDQAEPSVEKIYADLNGRRRAADDQIKKIDEAVARANKAAAQAEQLKGNTDGLRKDAQGVLDEARSAMRGATQVGLAESFVTERDAKLRGLAIYGGALVLAVA